MGRYKVMSRFEQAGMGEVYKCFDETAEQVIALKALPRKFSQDPLKLENIRKSFRMAHDLHHPHIVSCDALEKDPVTGDYYIIMEFTEGESLRTWLDRKRREKMLRIHTALRLIRQIAEALDCAHRKNIIHQSLKPDNILIDKRGEVKVVDFGLGAQLRSGVTREDDACGESSASGPYTAPEQWQGRTLGGASDKNRGYSGNLFLSPLLGLNFGMIH